MRKRVLITREAARAAELIRVLDMNDIEAIAEPVTRTAYLNELGELPDLAEFVCLAFTSSNGVNAFRELLTKNQQTLPQKMKIAVVGSATKRAVAAAGWTAEIVATKSSAIGLAEALINHRNSNSERALLWPCAEAADSEFENRLMDHGFRTKRFPIYRTVSIPPEELRGKLRDIFPWQAAVFAAPSAVRAFAAAWNEPWNFASVAIGETTANALKAVRISPITSPSPAAEALGEVIVQVMKEKIN